MDKVPIVMVGVLPPPVHGQSLATKALFEADIEDVEQVVVPIRSSKELDEVGKASVTKVLGLFGIIYRVFKAQSRSGARVMYYTAGSAAMVPFVRDLILLTVLRPLFKKTLIHYHSGGLPEYLASSWWKTILGKWVYGRDAWSISLSKYTPVPGFDFGAEREVEIPNGLDVPPTAQSVVTEKDEVIHILFIGNLYEDKGVFDTIAAVQAVAAKVTSKIHLSLVGNFPNSSAEQKILDALSTLPSSVEYSPPGPRYGEDKWRALSEADFFMFPTYYKLENLPLVVIEAMAYGLPIVSTKWRGVQSLVKHGVNGYLSEPKDVHALAESIATLVSDATLREKMAAASRAAYLKNYSFDRHIQRFRSTFLKAFEES